MRIGMHLRFQNSHMEPDQKTFRVEVKFLDEADTAASQVLRVPM